MRFAFIPYLIASLATLSACSDSDFAGTAAKKKQDDKKEAKEDTEDSPEGGAKKESTEGTPGETESDDPGAEEGSGGEEEADDQSGDLEETDVDVATLRKKCGTAAEKTKEVQLDFPSTEGTVCKWGQDSNLSAQTGSKTRAVFQQSKPLDMGKGKLCGIKFDGGSANVRYDDFMHFTFDDFVLASVQFTEAEFLAMGMVKVGELLKYERLKHIGKGPYEASMNSRTNSICPKGGTCSMVKSQTVGALAIDAPQAWFDLLPKETLMQDKHDLSVWVTGQANSTDCQHSGLSFKLSIKYVE